MNGILNDHDSNEMFNQWYTQNIVNAVPKIVEQLRPTLTMDGNQWCFLYGENLQDGVAGFGDTPIMAANDFENNFWNEKINTPVKPEQPTEPKKFMTLYEPPPPPPMNKTEDEDEFFSDEEGEFDDLETSCPNCGEEYDDIDFEYQICSICKFNANHKYL